MWYYRSLLKYLVDVARTESTDHPYTDMTNNDDVHVADMAVCWWSMLSRRWAVHRCTWIGGVRSLWWTSTHTIKLRTGRGSTPTSLNSLRPGLVDSDTPQFRGGNPYFFRENPYQSVSFIYASMYSENVHAIHTIPYQFTKKSRHCSKEPKSEL